MLSKEIQEKLMRVCMEEAEAAIAKHKAGITAREAANVAMNAMQEKFNFGRANATEFEQAKTIKVFFKALKVEKELTDELNSIINQIKDFLDFVNDTNASRNHSIE